VVVWKPGLSVYSALWGIAITVLDVTVFARQQRSRKEGAAKIQELFDCDVLDLNWHEAKIGRKPDAETIAEAAGRFRRADPNCAALMNWYPPVVGTLPMEIARIACQRANCWWDAKLRRRYANVTIAIVAALTGIVLVASLVGGFTLEKFILAGLVPLLPGLVLGIHHYDEQTDSAKSSDRLKDQAEALWGEGLLGKAGAAGLKAAARDLQDEIYDRRRTSPPIFDWVYQCLRRSYEEQMNKGAEALVAEARGVLSQRNP